MCLRGKSNKNSDCIDFDFTKESDSSSSSDAKTTKEHECWDNEIKFIDDFTVRRLQKMNFQLKVIKSVLSFISRFDAMILKTKQDNNLAS